MVNLDALIKGGEIGKLDLEFDVVFGENGPKGFKEQVIKALNLRMNKILVKSLTKIKSSVRRIIEQAIRSRKEYKSLLGSGPNSLHAELGLDRAQQRVDSIINIWLDSIKVTIRKSTGKEVKSFLRLTMGNADYSDVLSNPDAKILTKKGATLEWLRALLLWGDKVIVVDYEVKSSSRGRSGLAVMVKKLGKKWRVPPEYSGTANDNWITRALQPIEKEIGNILRKAVKK